MNSSTQFALIPRIWIRRLHDLQIKTADLEHEICRLKTGKQIEKQTHEISRNFLKDSADGLQAI